MYIFLDVEKGMHIFWLLEMTANFTPVNRLVLPYLNNLFSHIDNSSLIHILIYITIAVIIIILFKDEFIFPYAWKVFRHEKSFDLMKSEIISKICKTWRAENTGSRTNKRFFIHKDFSKLVKLRWSTKQKP